MLKALGRRSQVARPQSLPAPTGGLNARDNIADMNEKDALIMDNWFPETNDIRLRKGWADHVIGLPTQVESLMPYSAPNGTQTLFAASGTSFYNTTIAGAVGVAVVTGLTNARWQSVNYVNSSGTAYLCCFNGADNPEYWNGTTWIPITAISVPAITNVTTTTLISASVHKRRLWLVQVNTLKAWYLPVDSVGGAAVALDLAGIAYLGGYLVATATWTLDSGNGPDDLWVGVTSEGQVIVYSGTDPSSSTTWSLVGVWNIGTPIGRRCLIKYRGDLLIICHDGVLPLAKALQSTNVDRQIAITDKIQKIITEATTNYQDNFGWDLLIYPEASMLLLNVPVEIGANQVQYAMNLITGSWGGPFNISSNCWTYFNNEVYFGGDTFVAKFWGNLDDNGNDIPGDMKQAFSYFGTRGRLKQWRMMKPIFLANGTPTVFIGLNIDYGDSGLIGSLTFNPITFGVWDSGLWDVAIWSGNVSISSNWSTVSGVGTCAAPRIKSSCQGIELRLEATDHVFEFGGIVG